MLDWVAERWATPRASDAEKGGPHQAFGTGGEPLTAQAIKWPTPTAHDGRRPGADLTSKNGGNLSRDAALWPTPAVTDSNGARNHTAGRQAGSQHHDGVTLNDAIVLYPIEAPSNSPSSLPAPPISTDGATPSPPRRSLNPLFVEWLMGWPPGWTMLAPASPASTGSECSATALSHWKRRMRCALSSLALSDAAPPAQLSLLA